MVPRKWQTELDQATEKIHTDGRWRSLRPFQSGPGPNMQGPDKEVISFCSNDYLSLAGSKLLVDTATVATQAFGAGAGASRLIAGTNQAHQELETLLAQWKQTEASLIYGSGWQCNTGVLQSLQQLARTRLVFLTDALNHASLIDGMRGQHKLIYEHNDMRQLRDALASLNQSALPVIVTESIFSMDGDCASLEDIAELGRKHDALIYVDEAHAAGLFGPDGAGKVSEMGLQDVVHFQMGTLGKALGSYGAYVATTNMMRDWLINTSRPFIFTTAPPPASAAAASAAIHFAQQKRSAITAYLQRCSDFAERLRNAGLRIPETASPILPILVGEEEPTMALCEALWQQGFHVQGIRPPTVQPGTSRLRLTIQMGHTPGQLEGLYQALLHTMQQLNLL